MPRCARICVGCSCETLHLPLGYGCGFRGNGGRGGRGGGYVEDCFVDSAVGACGLESIRATETEAGMRLRLGCWEGERRTG